MSKIRISTNAMLNRQEYFMFVLRKYEYYSIIQQTKTQFHHFVRNKCMPSRMRKPQKFMQTFGVLFISWKYDYQALLKHMHMREDRYSGKYITHHIPLLYASVQYQRNSSLHKNLHEKSP